MRDFLKSFEKTTEIAFELFARIMGLLLVIVCIYILLKVLIALGAT